MLTFVAGGCPVIDPNLNRSYSIYLLLVEKQNMSNVDLQVLQDKVDSLLRAFHELEKENAALHMDRKSWVSERKELIAQNELAREKVKAILMRLKKMEAEG